MVKTKGASATSANYNAAIGRVPGAYKTGVEQTSGWQASAMAGETLYGQKVQEAVANRSRERGISRVSDSEWKTAAAGKGAARIGQGMQASAPKYASAMGEVLSVIEGVSIAARSADPMANVDGRVKPIVQALADYKKRR